MTMTSMWANWQGGRTAARRARNLRAGARAQAAPRRRMHAGGAAFWIGVAGAGAAVLGGWLIAAHARSLALAAGPIGRGDAVYQADVFQPLLAGVAFTVPRTPGIGVAPAGTAALLIASGMRAEPALRIDLCTQMTDAASGRLLPLHIGVPFSDVAAWAARGATSGRNIVLAAPGAPMPQIVISGVASADLRTPLQLRWRGAGADTRWIGDASGGMIARGESASVALGRDGWLLWGDGALRVVRRASAACPAAGELQLQLVRPGGTGAHAQVIAYGAGTALSASLPPGRYAVPAAPAPGLEDQALFEQLRARGLIRLDSEGLAALAPPDLAAWRAAPVDVHAAALAGWERTALDAAARKLVDRLYHRADGDFVRAQVAIFNSERRLLAWRMRPGAPAGSWQAQVGGAPVTVAADMPAAAARLFAQLPQGWLPWHRVAGWPDGATARLVYTLAQPASGAETLDLLIAGRVRALTGARIDAPAQDACTGRACPDAGAVRAVRLALLPGARQVVIDAAPLNAGAFAAPGDEQYRHLRLDTHGQLAWQTVARRAGAAAPAPVPVQLADRNGTPLWSDGAPSAAASAAGLAPLLGYRAEQSASVAGMLARVPGAAGHRARLSLDLALQASSQGALDCIGMRRGRWDGVHCAGASAAPAGRQAGMVILDAETGDVLAAAGAGGGQVDPANWREVRDFDRLDPARSPLRLPAFQHDGGAHRSPGSTFKIVSALALESAARTDPALDALIGGLPLADINRLARSRGFAFQTDAPAYPWGTPQAHITNYREQQLDRRAQNGRLGMAQALTYSLNTWFAWIGEMSDRTLLGKASGGAPGVQALTPAALDPVRPIVAMAHRLGFEQALRLDGGLLPPDFVWSPWDALQGTPAHIDPVTTRHELRQMAIGLRMQATPLQMALASAAVGQGRLVTPRLLLELDGQPAAPSAGPPTGVRLDRIRAGMKGVVDVGTGAGAFRGADLDQVRRGLSGKTGTAPTGPLTQDDGAAPTATVWFTGWLEPGSVPGQTHRLAFAVFVSHSEASGGEHAAPVVAAVLRTLSRNGEQRGK